MPDASTKTGTTAQNIFERNRTVRIACDLKGVVFYASRRHWESDTSRQILFLSSGWLQLAYSWYGGWRKLISRRVIREHSRSQIVALFNLASPIYNMMRHDKRIVSALVVDMVVKRFFKLSRKADHIVLHRNNMLNKIGLTLKLQLEIHTNWWGSLVLCPKFIRLGNVLERYTWRCRPFYQICPWRTLTVLYWMMEIMIDMSNVGHRKEFVSLLFHSFLKSVALDTLYDLLKMMLTWVQCKWWRKIVINKNSYIYISTVSSK